MQGVIDIEDLLNWTYRVQLADLILGLGVDLWHAERAAEGIEWRGHSADGVYAVLQRLRLGVRVDGSGMRMSADVDADAVIVHESVMKLGSVLATIVIRYARTGRRPGWHPDARFRYTPHWIDRPRYHEATGLPRKRSFLVVRTFARDRRLVSSYCPIVPVDHPDEVDQRRLTYRLWFDGVSALSNYLSTLTGLGFAAVSLKARAQPWLDEDKC